MYNSACGCKYGANSTVTVTGSNGTTIGTFDWAKAAACGDLTSYSYTGAADTLTLTITTGGNMYLPKLNVVYSN